MIAYRWLRAATRGVVGLLTILPVLALLLAVMLDRGAGGGLRDPGFPLALFASDPFAWTCVTNSLIFAASITGLSMMIGVGLGWMIARLRFWGRGVLRNALASMLAASPACLALGVLGLLGPPRHGPGPSSWSDATSGSLSLETWRGWPAWILWIWTSLPGAVALVALATARALERVHPAWLDAARLAGSGRLRTWHGLTWPLIRPSAARAAAIVFPIALLEPGVPLILGLRRTLAFQIVEAAGRPDPFPRLAVWTVMAAAIAFVGRLVLRWCGGPLLLTPAPGEGERGRAHPHVPRAGASLAMVCTAILAGAAILGWLPILGLVRPFPASVPGSGSATWSFGEVARRAMAPPVPQLVAHSCLLGLEVGAGVLLLAWVLRPDPGARLAPTIASRLVGRFALMPPLVQGVGILALPGLLASLAGAAMQHLPGLSTPLARVADLAHELTLERNPWGILSAAVALSVGARLLQAFRRAAEQQPDELRSGLEAALLAGPSRSTRTARGRTPPGPLDRRVRPGRAARRAQPGARAALHARDGRSDRRARNAHPRGRTV